MTTAQQGGAAREYVASKVRAKAAERRISIRALADKCGIEYSAMLRRTRGEVDFTADELVTIASRLDVNAGEFLPPAPTAQAVAS